MITQSTADNLKALFNIAINGIGFFTLLVAIYYMGKLYQFITEKKEEKKEETKIKV